MELLLLVVTCLAVCIHTVESFVPARSTRARALATDLHVGYFLNGITGTAPSSLLSETLQSSLVDSTSLEGKKLACVYKASRDGWNALDFHRCVDEKGSALVVAFSRSGKLFGGFNPAGWRSTDDYYNSNTAFLWYPKNGGGSVVKCPINTGGNAAIFDYATGGPCFGASDLLIGEPRAAVMGGFAGPDSEDISTSAGNLRQGKCSGFMAYDVSGGFPVRGDFSLTEIEVYVNNQFKDGLGSGGGTPSWWPF
jgi:TLD